MILITVKYIQIQYLQENKREFHFLPRGNKIFKSKTFVCFKYIKQLYAVFRKSTGYIGDINSCHRCKIKDR